MTALIVIGVILISIAGISNAIMDVVNFHFHTSIFNNPKVFNPNYWNLAVSWRNKYKNGDPTQGARFFGSTSFLVFLTDAWHLFKFIMLWSLFIVLGYPLAISLGFDTSIGIISTILCARAIYGAFFTLFYGRIFNKK